MSVLGENHQPDYSLRDIKIESIDVDCGDKFWVHSDKPNLLAEKRLKDSKKTDSNVLTLCKDFVKKANQVLLNCDLTSNSDLKIGDSHQIFSQQGVQCAGCNQNIADRYYLVAVDQKWHCQCLKCSSCGLNLSPERSCFSRDGEIYCKNDYYRLYCAQKCRRCCSLLEPDEMVMKVREDVYYHPGCFTCSICESHLHKNDYYGLIEGKILCQFHYRNMMASKDVDCSNPCLNSLHHPSDNTESAGDERWGLASPISSGALRKGACSRSRKRLREKQIDTNSNQGNGTLGSCRTPIGQNRQHEDLVIDEQRESEYQVEPQESFDQENGSVCNGLSMENVAAFKGDSHSDASGSSVRWRHPIGRTCGQSLHLASSLPQDLTSNGVSGVRKPTLTDLSYDPVKSPDDNDNDDMIMPSLVERCGKSSSYRQHHLERLQTASSPLSPSSYHMMMGQSMKRVKRKRTSFKHHQLKAMKQHFNKNHNPDSKELEQLSASTGLPKRVLQVWFQNARAKWRKSLLSQQPCGPQIVEESHSLADLKDDSDMSMNVPYQQMNTSSCASSLSSCDNEQFFTDSETISPLPIHHEDHSIYYSSSLYYSGENIDSSR